MEWRLAARHWGYRYDDEFCYLSGEQQATLVAAYRIAMHGEAVVAYESRPKGR